MYRSIPRPPISGLFLVAFSLIAGCQRFHPQSLNPGQHGDAWAQRAPAADAATGPSRPPVDLANGIALEEGEDLALHQNPTLRLLRLRAGISEAAASHAGRWQDPQFGLDALHINESMDDPWILTGSLALTVSVSGRLSAEREAARAQHAVDLYQVREAEWDVLHQVRRTWIRLSATQRSLDALADIQQHLDRLVESTQNLADAGEMLRTEASLFPIERVRLRMLHNRLTAESTEQRTNLLALLGLAPQSEVTIEPVPLAAEDTDSAMPKTTPIDRHPALLRLQGELQAAQYRLEQERRARRPDITVGPIVESDEGQGRVGGMVALPLPLLHGNRQAIAEAEAALRFAEGTLDAAHEQQIRKREQAERSLSDLHRHYEEMQRHLAPLVEQQFADALRLHQLGEGTGLILLESLVQSYETRLSVIELQRDIALAQMHRQFVSGPAPAYAARLSTPLESQETP